MQRSTAVVGVPLEFKLGDLVRNKSCFYEKYHGSPEYGIVVDIEMYDSVQSKGVKVLWAPHKKSQDYDTLHAFTTWKISNLVEVVSG